MTKLFKRCILFTSNHRISQHENNQSVNQSTLFRRRGYRDKDMSYYYYIILLESDIHPISPKTPAPQYQPIDRKKRKGKRVEDYSRDRAA